MPTPFSGVTPTWVIPYELEFHTIITQSETQKKNYQNLSGSTPVCRYKLKWTNLSDANFGILSAHYYARKGSGTSFQWKSVPAYIDTNHDGTPDGSDMYGRWIQGSFKFQPNAHSWDAEIDFEEEI